MTDDEDEKKYTPGKILRKRKKLRKEEKHELYELPDYQKEYVEWFKSQGGVFNNLGFAKFYLKNGLPYPVKISKLITIFRGWLRWKQYNAIKT